MRRASSSQEEGSDLNKRWTVVFERFSSRSG